ncbi:MAG: amidohydrolase [Chloroflexi bacterium]|nr:amidohydrolase [Chloroflexota bacterium]
MQVLLENARIYRTADDPRPASVLLADCGRVTYVGDDPSAYGRLGPNAERRDLGGATVVPGLADAHLHLAWIAEGLSEVDTELPALAEALAAVRAHAQGLPEGAWLVGYGWNHHAWGGEWPTAALLDAVSAGHPAILAAKSGHAAWVNTAALALAGITAATPDPAGGQIVRASDGSPNGILLETAAEAVYRVIPPTPPALRLAAMRKALSHLAGLGFTCVHDMDGAKSFAELQALDAAGELPLRIVHQLREQELEGALAMGLRSGFGSERLMIGALKLFMDGALGARTAWMLAPYEGEASYAGMSAADPAAVREAIRRANAGGIACAVHAIGDRAVRQLLDDFEQVGSRALRNRIEHLQCIDRDDLPRLGALNLAASMQPLHASSDRLMAERHWGARCAASYAWRTVAHSGAVLALGSDCPVETADPLRGLYAARTRRNAEGEGSWYPAECLSAAEALRGYSWGPAWAAGQEHWLGTLQPGMAVDATILSGDPLTCPPAELLEMRVLGTLVGATG